MLRRERARKHLLFVIQDDKIINCHVLNASSELDGITRTTSVAASILSSEWDWCRSTRTAAWCIACSVFLMLCLYDFFVRAGYLLPPSIPASLLQYPGFPFWFFVSFLVLRVVFLCKTLVWWLSYVCALYLLVLPLTWPGHITCWRC